MKRIVCPERDDWRITAENAGALRAKIIGEGANGPVTSDAEIYVMQALSGG